MPGENNVRAATAAWMARNRERAMSLAFRTRQFGARMLARSLNLKYYERNNQQLGCLAKDKGWRWRSYGLLRKQMYI